MDYTKNDDIGKNINKERIIERVIEKNSVTAPPIDVNALAQAIAIAMQSSPNSYLQPSALTINTTSQSFDSTNTLEKLAQSMTVQRGKNESNFGDSTLGNECRTKTDKEEVNKTIDLLSNLD